METQMTLSLGIDEPAVEERKSLISEIEKLKDEGKTDSPLFKERMRELEEVLGIASINPFGTNEVEIFKENLSEMNVSDMQALATKIGVPSSRDRSSLKRILLKAFGDYSKNNSRNIMPQASQGVHLDPNNPQHAKTIKILGEIQ